MDNDFDADDAAEMELDISDMEDEEDGDVIVDPAYTHEIWPGKTLILKGDGIIYEKVENGEEEAVGFIDDGEVIKTDD